MGKCEIINWLSPLRETLMGKYGQDSKLIYDLADQGEREQVWASVGGVWRSKCEVINSHASLKKTLTGRFGRILSSSTT